MSDEIEKLRQQQAEIQRQIDAETAKLQEQKSQENSQLKTSQETYRGRVITYKNNSYKVNAVIQEFATLKEAKIYIDNLSTEESQPTKRDNNLSSNEKKWIGIISIFFIFTGLFFLAKQNSNNDSDYSSPDQGNINAKSKSNFIRGMTYKLPAGRIPGNCSLKENEICIDEITYEKLCKNAEGFTQWGFRTSADAYFGMGDYLATNGEWVGSSIKWETYTKSPPTCVARLTLEGIYKGNSVRWKSHADVNEFLINNEGKVLVHYSQFRYEER